MGRASIGESPRALLTVTRARREHTALVGARLSSRVLRARSTTLSKSPPAHEVKRASIRISKAQPRASIARRATTARRELPRSCHAVRVLFAWRVTAPHRTIAPIARPALRARQVRSSMSSVMQGASRSAVRASAWVALRVHTSRNPARRVALHALQARTVSHNRVCPSSVRPGALRRQRVAATAHSALLAASRRTAARHTASHAHLGDSARPVHPPPLYAVPALIGPPRTPLPRLIVILARQGLNAVQVQSLLPFAPKVRLVPCHWCCRPARNTMTLVSDTMACIGSIPSIHFSSIATLTTRRDGWSFKLALPQTYSIAVF